MLDSAGKSPNRENHFVQNRTVYALLAENNRKRTEYQQLLQQQARHAASNDLHRKLSHHAQSIIRVMMSIVISSAFFLNLTKALFPLSCVNSASHPSTNSARAFERNLFLLRIRQTCISLLSLYGSRFPLRARD